MHNNSVDTSGVLYPFSHSQQYRFVVIVLFLLFVLCPAAAHAKQNKNQLISTDLSYLLSWDKKDPYGANSLFDDPNVLMILERDLPQDVVDVLTGGWEGGNIVSHPVEVENNILKVSACRPHYCGSDNITVYIDIISKRAVGFYHENGHPVEHITGPGQMHQEKDNMTASSCYSQIQDAVNGFIQSHAPDGFDFDTTGEVFDYIPGAVSLEPCSPFDHSIKTFPGMLERKRVPGKEHCEGVDYKSRTGIYSEMYFPQAYSAIVIFMEVDNSYTAEMLQYDLQTKFGLNFTVGHKKGSNDPYLTPHFPDNCIKGGSETVSFEYTDGGHYVFYDVSIIKSNSRKRIVYTFFVANSDGSFYNG